MKFICGLLILSLQAWAQGTPPVEVKKIIKVRYVDATRIQVLLGKYATPTITAGWTILTGVQADNSLHTLVITGTPDKVAAYEEAVRKVDVAPAAFELTVYLISSALNDQVPDALLSTAKQLHGLFAFKGYQLLESFMLRGADGQRATSKGTFSKDGKTSSYVFTYERASVSDEAPKSVNLHNLDLNVRLNNGLLDNEGNPQGTSTGLHTDIDIRDGQKVVVGKSDVNGGGAPLILVVTAKVVE